MYDTPGATRNRKLENATGMNRNRLTVLMTDGYGMNVRRLGAGSLGSRMRLENADVSFNNEVLILDHKRGWQPIRHSHAHTALLDTGKVR